MISIMKKFSLSIFVIIAMISIATIQTVIVSKVSYEMTNKSYENKVKDVIRSTLAQIESYTQDLNQGKITIEQARESVKKIITNTKSLGGEYVFMIDTDVNMVLHPISTNLNGQNVANTKDAQGKNLFIEMVDLAKKKNSGFVNYYWKKPNEIEPSPKKSYIQLIPELNWIIGSGIYTDEVNKVVFNTILTELVPTFFLSLIVIGFTIFKTKSTKKELEKIGVFIQEVLKGDLKSKLEYNSDNDINKLCEYINQIVSSFGLIITEVKINVEKVNKEAREISSKVNEVAKLTDKASLSTSSVATAAEEISVTSHDIAKNTSNAASISNQTRDLSTDGVSKVSSTTEGIQTISNVVNEFANATNELTSSARKIEEIVTVITSIADQTNLLALNAAIEAARAGDAGRGFAVVADEVRQLASKTTIATNDISNLLNEIGTQTQKTNKLKEQAIVVVESGLVSGQQSHEVLGKIYEQIETSSDQLLQIATASEQQSSVISDITKTIQSIHDTLMECSKDCTSSSKEIMNLSSQSQRLKELVEHFKV